MIILGIETVNNIEGFVVLLLKVLLLLEMLLLFVETKAMQGFH